MDLLCNLAPNKAKSITYCFNNNKIRKIISIQRKKEAILATVEKLKEKLTRWRAFTRTTLVNTAPESKNIDEEAYKKYLLSTKQEEDIGDEANEIESPTKRVTFEKKALGDKDIDSQSKAF